MAKLKGDVAVRLKCRVPGCKKAHERRGLCIAHYTKAFRLKLDTSNLTKKTLQKLIEDGRSHNGGKKGRKWRVAAPKPPSRSLFVADSIPRKAKAKSQVAGFFGQLAETQRQEFALLLPRVSSLEERMAKLERNAPPVLVTETLAKRISDLEEKTGFTSAPPESPAPVEPPVAQEPQRVGSELATALAEGLREAFEHKNGTSSPEAPNVSDSSVV